MSPVRLSI